MVAHYMQYYDTQVGGGGRINNVFVGAPYQRGHGIGRFLGGLFRSVFPLFKRGAKAIGKEALRAGLNVMEDITTNDIPFKESIKRHAKDAGGNLKRKANEKLELLMSGSGYNNLNASRAMQSLIGRAPIRTVARKRATSATSAQRRRRRRR